MSDQKLENSNPFPVIAGNQYSSPMGKTCAQVSNRYCFTHFKED